MKEFLLAVTASCLIVGGSYANIPYTDPPKFLPDVSDFGTLPKIDPFDLSIEFGFTAYTPDTPKKTQEIPSRLERARKYLGTNPTGWAHLWCAKFLAMIEPPLAKKVKNPNEARSWAALPKAPKEIGRIVVLSRRGGGHIGIISKVLPNGDLIVLSGNHNHKVAEGHYSKSRIIAIVG